MFYCCFLTSCDISHRFRGLHEDFEKKSMAHIFKNKLSVHMHKPMSFQKISEHTKIQSVTLLLVRLRVFVDVTSYQIFH